MSAIFRQKNRFIIFDVKNDAFIFVLKNENHMIFL